ncbi:hypothetical protein DSM3645_28812 [Blastopirellula marina DSM 3645]|uniref:Uncharacterized protein n=1 Tax=Blastopirellula marina DSM 3645 TaxID=314230 RepID=A3ZPI4_9BACT|nr:hypothetical protein DSM3645_28812 [Blastopirellula marina DSM 3645]
MDSFTKLEDENSTKSAVRLVYATALLLIFLYAVFGAGGPIAWVIVILMASPILYIFIKAALSIWS